ncbi:hypothetical protein Har1130_18235 [Haloarcula sp. CBA1130]|uniref:hypothetical protein n=1 Tax=Haloarcula sp. CBA1130 TaxID=1853685 RepID=UPI001248CA95|nr:hypothetical protein [Haloarcula sp. CBA1130]KAA9396584.1 hypothetical protein Har1130_18235 [Haloarcula sp. CBA1130]
MASKTTNSSQTGKQAKQSESQSFPELTVQAEGTADRLRRVNETGKADCLETVEVELAVEYVIDSYDEWCSLIDPDYVKHGRTVEKGTVIDDLLDRLEEHYRRQSSSRYEASDWKLTVTGSATAWRRLFMECMQLRGSDLDRADKGTLRLKQLLAADLADTGAALAALELINQHGLDASPDSFIDEVADGTGCE